MQVADPRAEFDISHRECCEYPVYGVYKSKLSYLFRSWEARYMSEIRLYGTADR